jgi:hypothetical protein
VRINPLPEIVRELYEMVLVGIIILLTQPQKRDAPLRNIKPWRGSAITRCSWPPIAHSRETESPDGPAA